MVCGYGFPAWRLARCSAQACLGAPATSLGGDRMDGSADRFLDLMHQLEDFTRSVSPEQAHSQFDETTLQPFWMRWPQLAGWTGSLWRRLSEELAGPSAPHDESELFEIGESG